MWDQIEFALHASLARVLTKVATLLPAVLSLGTRRTGLRSAGAVSRLSAAPHPGRGRL